MCALLAVLPCCHSDEDDYTTSAVIELSLPVEGVIETLQYSVTMVNLNSKYPVTSAGRSSCSIIIGNVLRGAYSINVEGVVRYAGADGVVVTSQFRAQSEYVSIVDLEENKVSLEMILMN
jgi:hypothetical protein